MRAARPLRAPRHCRSGGASALWSAHRRYRDVRVWGPQGSGFLCVLVPVVDLSPALRIGEFRPDLCALPQLSCLAFRRLFAFRNSLSHNSRGDRSPLPEAKLWAGCQAGLYCNTAAICLPAGPSRRCRILLLQPQCPGGPLSLGPSFVLVAAAPRGAPAQVLVLPLPLPPLLR